jgi:hypothetical protein
MFTAPLGEAPRAPRSATGVFPGGRLRRANTKGSRVACPWGRSGAQFRSPSRNCMVSTADTKNIYPKTDDVNAAVPSAAAKIICRNLPVWQGMFLLNDRWSYLITKTALYLLNGYSTWILPSRTSGQNRTARFDTMFWPWRTQVQTWFPAAGGQSRAVRPGSR